MHCHRRDRVLHLVSDGRRPLFLKFVLLRRVAAQRERERDEQQRADNDDISGLRRAES